MTLDEIHNIGDLLRTIIESEYCKPYRGELRNVKDIIMDTMAGQKRQIDSCANYQERIELIKELSAFHPAMVMDVNSKMAHYTGGMKDDGDLNWAYCLFEANLRDLRMVVKMMKLK